MFQRIKTFLKEGLWDLSLENLRGIQKTAVKYLRIIIFSFRKLGQDQMALRAPALAFFSLLSVVPLAALVFGVAKGFGFQDVLQNQLTEQLALHGEVESIILDFAQTTLKKARGGLVAGLGFVILFVSVTVVLSTVEDSFNKVWGIQRGRSLSVKIRDYFSMIFVGTILLLVSLSLTVALTDIPSFFGYLSGVISFLVSLVPYTLIWFLFAFLIIFMPNRRVGLKAGLFGGIVAGTLYQLILNFYIRLQVTVSVYNAVYGSFAALPLFLIWLQVSWICLLLGAELAFSFENLGTMNVKRKYSDISIRARIVVLIHVVYHIIRAFKKDSHSPPSIERIAGELKISEHLVSHVLDDLIEEGLIVEVSTRKGRQTGYMPGVPTERLTVHRVIKAVEERGESAIVVRKDKDLRRIQSLMDEWDEMRKNSSLNVKIEDLS